MDKYRKSFCDSIMGMTDAAWGATSQFLQQHGLFTPVVEAPKKARKAEPEPLSPEEEEQLTVMERLSGVKKGKSRS